MLRPHVARVHRRLSLRRLSHAVRCGEATDLDDTLSLASMAVEPSQTSGGGDSFSGIGWTPPGAKGIYGGHFLSHAISATAQTLPSSDFRLHSLHASFLRSGKSGHVVEYDVDRNRDGRQFAARSVVGSQSSKPIFRAQLSYHRRPADAGLSHTQTPRGLPADVRPPSELPSLQELMAKQLAREGTSRRGRAFADAFDAFALEMRRQDLRAGSADAARVIWMRSKRRIGDDPLSHLLLLAWASDWNLCSTALLPHGVIFPDPRVKMMTSLDHAMWWHGDSAALNLDDWCCHYITSPCSGGTRGLVTSRIFDRSGTLLASCAQEALIHMAEGGGE